MFNMFGNTHNLRNQRGGRSWRYRTTSWKNQMLTASVQFSPHNFHSVPKYRCDPLHQGPSRSEERWFLEDFVHMIPQVLIPTTWKGRRCKRWSLQFLSNLPAVSKCAHSWPKGFSGLRSGIIAMSTVERPAPCWHGVAPCVARVGLWSHVGSEIKSGSVLTYNCNTVDSLLNAKKDHETVDANRTFPRTPLRRVPFQPHHVHCPSLLSWSPTERNFQLVRVWGRRSFPQLRLTNTCSCTGARCKEQERWKINQSGIVLRWTIEMRKILL